jgi:uncharacterized protein
MKRILAFIVFLLPFFALAQTDGGIPARPNPPKLVNDYTGTLTPAQVQALENKLVAYDDSTSSQIAVVIVNTTGNLDIAEYGLKLGRDWGVGGAEFRNGVILLIALDDRRSRIEVGYGLEGAIPDITAKSILDNSLTPQFRAGNYYRGIDLATNDIIAAAAGEYKAPAGYGDRNKKGGGIGLGSIIFFLVLFMLIGGMGGRGRGGRGNGGMASAAGWIIGSMLGSGSSRGGGWSGGGGGGWSGGGGGGFGGFGGGGFGGGGASGSW